MEIVVKNTRLKPGQIWKYHFVDEIKIFIIKQVVSPEEIYMYGFDFPFKEKDFHWLVPVKIIKNEDMEVQTRIFKTFDKYDLEYNSPVSGRTLAVIFVLVFLILIFLIA